ncbi:hypothetical protein [Halobacteriovorax sp. DA5]|uniref:hypothetical protein n=1 Tax=Halobacteriovorax sp. DA5 TaxID=2067553 RepID=UPI000CD31086|nr:hypothetical protein [Halobacteriovorax sp. DA5]POB15143.1 hypothetical protein C0Z22_01815 [Halobacteriovorax sp. DA5]
MKLSLINLISLMTVFTLNTLASDCDFNKKSIDPSAEIIGNIKLIEVATNALRIKRGNLDINTDLSKIKKIDRRKQKNKNSPKILDAVGRIDIRFSNGDRASCSGTLIAAKPGQSSRTISSAGHCFGNTKTKSKYDIKYITWITTTKSGKKIAADLTLEDLNLDHDNALLSMKYKIPFSTITPALYENEVAFDPSDMIFYNEKSKIIAAGYSTDDYLGKNGEVLTYDDQITYNHLNRSLSDEFNHISSITFETVSFSGASGGALLIDTDLSEEDIENPYKQTYYIGTLIQVGGNGAEIYGYKNRSTVGSDMTISRSYQMLNPEIINHLNDK